MPEQINFNSKASLASFDVFETLVTRVSGGSRSVFACVERRALAEGLEVAGFAEERVVAEGRALDSVGAANLKLADIYAHLDESRYVALRDRLMKMELDAEVDLCVPIDGGIKRFYWCLENCDAVVVISDMYLPEITVAKILEKCGVSGYSRLFVSCEYSKTKANGELFKRVANDLGVEPAQITHHGDNLHSDVLMARKCGLNAIAMMLGREVPVGEAAARKVRGRILPFRMGFLKTLYLSKSDDDLIGQLGYCVLGPLLVSFCEWLHARRVEDRLDGLWFVARDGWIMKRCYDFLYPDERTEYILASRRSTTVPMLTKNLGISGFVKTVGLGRETSIAEILMRLGLSEDRASALADAHGFKSDERLIVSELEYNSRFLSLYEEAEYLVSDNASAEFSAMALYLNDSIGDADSIGLVDLGWRGSIQHAIELALREVGLGEVDVEGLYLGVDVDSAWWGRQSMSGFLFSPDKDTARGIDERWFNALVEALFMAPHGSVRRYSIDEDGHAAAVLEPREGGNEDSSPIFLAQEAALRFARDYRARRWGEYGLLKMDYAVSAFYRLGLKPKSAEAIMLGDCIFAYQEVSKLACPKHKLGHYVFHISELIREMNVCYWKPAYLKRLLRLPLPYWKLLKVLKTVAKR